MSCTRNPCSKIDTLFGCCKVQNIDYVVPCTTTSHQRHGWESKINVTGWRMCAADALFYSISGYGWTCKDGILLECNMWRVFKVPKLEAAFSKRTLRHSIDIMPPLCHSDIRTYKEVVRLAVLYRYFTHLFYWKLCCKMVTVCKYLIFVLLI